MTKTCTIIETLVAILVIRITPCTSLRLKNSLTVLRQVFIRQILCMKHSFVTLSKSLILDLYHETEVIRLSSIESL